MVEGGQRSGFPLEAGEPIRIAREAVGQHLDGRIAAQVSVARSVDLSHTTRAEWTENLVSSKATAGRQAHSSRSEMRGYDTARTIVARTHGGGHAETVPAR